MEQPAVPYPWPGRTIVCLGGGPSLTPEDIDTCRSAGALLLAISDTYRLAPDAIAVFASDKKWWLWHLDALEHPGLKFMLPPSGDVRLRPVTVLRRAGQIGVELEDRGALRSGGHSGYAGINLAAHLVGPGSRILLLGYDLQATGGQHHWFGDHPDKSHPRYDHWPPIYQTALAPLAAANITLINCSRETAITAVPRVPLDEALHARSA